MALPYKQGKTLITIKEMSKVGNDYEVNGTGSANIFMWRKPQEAYEPIPSGDYTIVQEAGNRILRITNNAALAEIERFQVLFIFNDTTAKYEETGFKIDPEVLTERYNGLVDNFKMLYEYVAKTAMIADGEDFSIVLPTLNEGEVWVKTEDSWRGFQVGKLEQEIRVLLDAIEASASEALIDIDNSKNSSLLAITNTGDMQNTRILNQGNTQSNRLNAIDSQASIKFDLMQRMMAVIVGANRWLDGGNIATRDTDNLERTADGGDITLRTGDPSRVYDGGDITQRVVDMPVDIDCGDITQRF